MRIGLYINDLKAGGAERVVSRLSFILSTTNHTVYFIVSDGTVLSYPYDGNLIDLKVPATKGINKFLTILKRTNELKKIKKEKELDVVISFLDGANLVNILSHHEPCKNIVSIRNFQQEEYKYKKHGSFSNLVSNYIYKKADYVICCSKLICEETKKQFSISDKKVDVLYNPYNCEQIKQDSLKQDFKEYKDFSDQHDLTLVTTGRLTYQKGYWHLVKIISQLRNSGVNVGCLIIGEGTYKSNIQQLITEFKLFNHIKLCGYQKNPYAIEKYADAYILTSLFEGFPNSMVEAMCLGLPIISADCKSGPREILAPNKSLYSKLDSVYQEYGILMPELENMINWSTEISVVEREWINIIKSLDKNMLQEYSIKGLQRVNDFSYDSIKNTLGKYLQRYTL
ncbi:MAG: glycosyltransferase [Sphaerochaetaceae bacterium]|nr:glycosyltransferase [Sphaerochaetaceae bacterium]